jgi:hypothetical protein
VSGHDVGEEVHRRQQSHQGKRIGRIDVHTLLSMVEVQ